MNIEDYEIYHKKGGTYIMPVEVFNELYEEMENWKEDCNRYKRISEEKEQMIIIMEKYLEIIHDLAFDYDGLKTVESLEILIDELDRYARLGRVCNLTEPIYYNGVKKFNILHEELNDISK